ncbi:MAG: LpqB family beta-propeller domain-containing protein [Pseudolysinimonas sp.]
MTRASRVRIGRVRMSGLAALATLGLLAGCVSIPTGGGVTTTQVQINESDNPLLSLPYLPTKDASPEEIISDFLRNGRSPQDNFKVAREYLTGDVKVNWVPGARTLISATAITPIALADNTWSVTVSAGAAIDSQGRFQTAAPADSYDLTFGLIKNADDQWRISSVPDGTVLSPNRFSSVFAPYELYYFDPSFTYLVPDLRWFHSGSSAAGSVVDALLVGPSDRLGDGALFSAFPDGTQRKGPLAIISGVATVPLSRDVSAGSASTHRYMQQQLLQSLRSVASVREVDMLVNDFTVQVPDGGTLADTTYLVGSDPIGGVKGRVGVLSTEGVTAIPGIGRSADTVGATGGSIVSHDRSQIALLSKAGVTIVRAGRDPAVIDGRSGLVVPSLDPLGFTWSVPAKAPAQLLAIGPDGTQHAVSGLPADGRVVSIDVSRDGARLLVALSTAGGPRLLVAGIQRDADLIPTGLVTPLDLPIGDAPLIDAAWIDGVTVVALTDDGALTSVDSYDIGGQHRSLGALNNGVAIVGGNTAEGTRVLDNDGHVLRPGGGTSWTDTGISASFLVSQQ